MKLNLLSTFLLLTQLLYSQTFMEINSPFEGVVVSSVAFSDVNNDGYVDVLITGNNNSSIKIAKLYTNDGTGNFTEIINTPFDGVWSSSIDFADVNGDGYEDVLITGENNSQFRIAKLYINDGTGNFMEMINTPFDGVRRSSIGFSDVNDDGNQDVLITGLNNSEQKITKLYVNDGLGNFTEIMNTPFIQVSRSAIAFSDINSDGYEDVLITGWDNSQEKIAKLYINDGIGNFTEIVDTPFDGVSIGDIAFSDINGNSYPDVLITGSNNNSESISKLYINNGLGNFTEVEDTPFPGVVIGSVAFSDINNDGSNDVFITGENYGTLITKLYTNDGMGNFTEILDTPFEPVRSSSVAPSDVNGDGKVDVLITGAAGPGVVIAKLYINSNISTTIDENESEDEFEFIVFPNPLKSSSLKLSYYATTLNQISIKIYDNFGVLRHVQMESTIIGNQIFSLNIGSLTAGIYFLELDNSRKKIISKFLVQ